MIRTRDETAVAITPPLSELAHPLAVEIARHACRTFAASRRFHDEALARYEALPDEEAGRWALLLDGLTGIDIAAGRACLGAMLGLRPVGSTMDAEIIDRGNLGIVVDGNLYTLVYDRDESKEIVHESSRPSPGERWSRGVYKVHAVPLDQVLGLEPDHDGPPVPTAPPSTTFGVGALGWRVRYEPAAFSDIASSRDQGSVTWLPEPNGGAFVFTRLDGSDREEVAKFHNLTQPQL
jgi:hypothetical protein